MSSSRPTLLRLRAVALLLLVLVLPVQPGLVGAPADALSSSGCGPDCCCLEREAPAACCCCGQQEGRAQGCDCGRVPLDDGQPSVAMFAPEARGDLRGLCAQIEELAWTARHLPLGPPQSCALTGHRARNGPGCDPPGVDGHEGLRGPAGRRLLARGAPGLLSVLCVARI